MAELTQNEKRLLATLANEHKADAPHLATLLDASPESVGTVGTPAGGQGTGRYRADC